MWKVESKKYEPSLRKGQRLAFSLRVNPVVRRRTGSGVGKRHDVVMDAKIRKGYREAPANKRQAMAAFVEEAAKEWLNSRAAKNGFEIDDEITMVEGYGQNRERKGKGKTIQFSTIDFKGVLTVSDPDSFEKVLFKGIGSAKAFGCGLMLVRPV